MIVPFFAATSLDLPTSTKVPGLVASDLILIIGLAALIFGAIITWVVFVRGPKKHPAERRDFKPPAATVKMTADGRERRRKKKRERRREHRQVNPTLAQTGGLPPPRGPEQIADP
jgi:hypothetical protein